MKASPLAGEVQRELSHFARPLFAHVARYSEEKNQSLLFSAFRKLYEEGAQTSLIVIGGGYEAVDRSSLAPNIHILGQKTNVGDYLLNVDGFCLTSRVEGCPISLIEALSGGVTPVCTPVGGIPDMIEDGRNGYLSTGLDTDSYVNALKAAMEHPVRSEVLIGTYEDKFSISACAEKYLEIYRD